MNGSGGAPELWGGIECTVNRVGDAYHDQLEFGGHAHRPDDLDRVHRLGLRTLRYPLLWERTAPDGLHAADWRFGDDRLGRLRALGIRPVLGLVHHGSGPRQTNLLDPSFARGLAEYAGAVARRYPWIDAYTPVNEPLTTARFSALYGHWYPHLRDEGAMFRALVHECQGTAGAMRAIRAVNPAAQLVQTDDLGTVYSTPGLAYQADYENERRWLGWDLLCGRVDRGHPMRARLEWAGVRPADLDALVADPCPPDVIGINHYLTSDRFLHERPAHFPPSTWGGNGRHRYADVEAVRVLDPPSDGLALLLDAAWRRYRRPIAITEAHLGCSRDEQLRWLYEIWTTACAARSAGIDVVAVAVWALFGSHDWNSLLTRIEGYYEPGAFDVRGGVPRPTALAALVAALAGGRVPADDPVLGSPGWWRRPGRLLHALAEEPRAQARAASDRPAAPAGGRAGSRPLLITGATGTLGRAFDRLCGERGLRRRLVTRHELDIAAPDSLARALDEVRPWAVVNAAGYVRVDEAELEAARCRRENLEGPRALATECAARGIRLLTFSSDLVFDGRSGRPYVESDPVRPLGVYGESKAQAEEVVRSLDPGALVVRTSAFFGPWDPHNFLTIALRTLAAGERFEAANDAFVSPTYVPDLVGTSLDLLLDGERGLWHLANAGAVTWLDFARLGAERGGIASDRLAGVPGASLGWRARRPRYSVLSSERAVLLPPLEDALTRYIASRGVARAA
jgi:dTDP-4-dehydrorhamnose reductase